MTSTICRPGRTPTDAQATRAGAGTTTDRQTIDDAHVSVAVGDNGGRGRTAKEDATPNPLPLFDPALCLSADVLDDIERVRIANENRLRQLTRSAEDSDGELRGFGLDESHPDVARLAVMVSTLKRVEHDATLQLQRQLRRHPLAEWLKSQRGIGEKQGARLLAAIGDPYWNSAADRPRTVSALWAYCGLHVLPSGSAARRIKGQQDNWSATAKKRVHLIAESCVKQIVKPCHAAVFEGHWLAVHYDACACSPYRCAYDRRRMHTAKTQPEWTDGHSHIDALRVASKAILRDLWRAASAARKIGGAS